MLKSFILKSKKIYTIMGVGIAVCLLVLTANISYDLGREQTGYSEEYLQAYGIYMWAYGNVELPQETAREWAASACNLQVGK